VELAGALAEIANDSLRHDFRSIHPEESRILVLDALPRVLTAFPESLSAAAERQLVRLGVRVIPSVRVTAIDANGVTYATSTGAAERIEAHTVLWAAGVKPSPWGEILLRRAGAELDRTGRVKVNTDLTIPGHPEIFVIGDLAYREQDGVPLPGIAPVAMQEGRYAASVIVDRLEGRTSKPFSYFDKGYLAVVGRNSGVGVIGGLRLHGFIAWFVWLFVHLMYLAQALNRVLVFLRWGYQYVTFYRGARLITGDDDPPEHQEKPR
jgi:NADH dehydrogenase